MSIKDDKENVSYGRIIDFENEFSEVQQDISKVSRDLSETASLGQQNTQDLWSLEMEIEGMYKQLGLEPLDNGIRKEYQTKVNLKVYSQEYFQGISTELEKELLAEVTSKKNLTPSLSKLDMTVALVIGCVAAIVDLLFVKIPVEVNYLGKYQQSGSGITEWLRSQGVNEDGQLNNFFKGLEKSCKVSFDASNSRGVGDYNGELNGFYPKTHRLMSLGHDPFFGIIFGLIDMLNGTLTLIDAKGVIHHIPIENYQNQPVEKMIFVPFVWIGHILSDVCTKMGIPVPGWGFTQLLQFGSFGEKGRSIADIARWMYLEGYDLRHFLTMSLVPGIIELLVRIYFRLTSEKEDFLSPLYAQNLRNIQNNIRLQKLLFTAHSVAVSGNILKVFLAHGNPLALNSAELLGFAKQSVQMTLIRARNTTAEQMIRNRENIDSFWGNLNSSE
ncbi:hypothetical protein [Ectobacillus panaciterrae]|uniref:hypothetical protein n=1 Tax=Ectobacillus panaciterrae TaxID=363872 RepID=UPI00040A6E9E|nr:hypothetical protein [Ectobacillus panaciterrae]